MQETPVQFLGWKDLPGKRRHRLPTPVFLGFPGGSAGEESACNVETWVPSLSWEDPLKKGIPTPVFWPGEFPGLYSPCTKS